MIKRSYLATRIKKYLKNPQFLQLGPSMGGALIQLLPGAQSEATIARPINLFKGFNAFKYGKWKSTILIIKMFISTYNRQDRLRLMSNFVLCAKSLRGKLVIRSNRSVAH